MIQNEDEYRQSQELLVGMYRLRDRMAAEASWTPGGRRDAVAGVEAQIRRIEREVAAYLTERLSSEPAETEPARAA